MKIRKTIPEDLNAVLNIHRSAFSEEPVVSGLVNDLFSDKSAKPVFSLIAIEGDRPVGHILFTNAKLEGGDNVKASILAPLGVIPEYQKKGIGGELIKEGLKTLKENGIDLVFVLSHPEYYPRFGFVPDAKKQGFDTTYPIREENYPAWMVANLTGTPAKGRIICADAMAKEEYWMQ